MSTSSSQVNSNFPVVCAQVSLLLSVLQVCDTGLLVLVPLYQPTLRVQVHPRYQAKARMIPTRPVWTKHLNHSPKTSAEMDLHQLQRVPDGKTDPVPVSESTLWENVDIVIRGGCILHN